MIPGEPASAVHISMSIAKPRAENESESDMQRLVAGRYRLFEQIGSGRLGDIYAAEDIGRRALGIEERAAVQLLSDSVAENNSLIEKLELGYAALRGASHPSIVSYLNIGKDGRCGYVVMELLDGLSIRDVLRQSSDLPLDEVLPVVRAVGEALQFLHSQSIVHGKVTAKNVLVTEGLDVHLLDVIPLPSSDSVLRGVAEQAPLNRAAAQDDVFGLACLAYEMLTGRHPFNYQSLPDVVKGGLEPEPITTIPEAQWNALRRTLVANADNGIRSLAEFLQEFGINGSERLRQTQPEEPAASESIPVPPAMVIDAEEMQDKTASRPRALRSLLLFAGLVALGAWYLLGEPQARVVAFLESLRPLAAVPETIVEPVAPPAQSDALLEQPADSTITDEPETTEVFTEALPESVEVITEALPESAEVATEVLPETTEVTTEALPETATTELPVESDFAFDAPVVTVSERDGAARVTVRRPENIVEGVSWWVTGHTAVEGRDYVILQGELAGTETGSTDTVLLIPLVNDATAEPLEDFFVHLGRRVAPGGQLVPMDTVRVDIVDDD